MKMNYTERHAEERNVRAERAKEARDRINANMKSRMGEKDFNRWRELSREHMFARKAKDYEKCEAIVKEVNELLTKYDLNH